MSGAPMTAHTTNPVPVVLVTPDDHRLRHSITPGRPPQRRGTDLARSHGHRRAGL